MVEKETENWKRGQQRMKKRSRCNGNAEEMTYMNKRIVDLQDFVRMIAREYGSRDAYRYLEEGGVVSKTYKELEKISML